MTVTNKLKYTTDWSLAIVLIVKEFICCFSEGAWMWSQSRPHHLWLFFTGLWHSNLEVNKADGIYVSVARSAIHIVPNHKNNDTYKIVHCLEIVVRLYISMSLPLLCLVVGGPFQIISATPISLVAIKASVPMVSSWIELKVCSVDVRHQSINKSIQ